MKSNIMFIKLSIITKVVRFGYKVDQIGPKWDTSGTFSDQSPNFVTLAWGILGDAWPISFTEKFGWYIKAVIFFTPLYNNNNTLLLFCTRNIYKYKSGSKVWANIKFDLDLSVHFTSVISSLWELDASFAQKWVNFWAQMGQMWWLFQIVLQYIFWPEKVWICPI